ncbi:MAG: UDP-N-acetylmuramoyl-tripeptide--D-alanyl-D-alanine ligase [Planctomycetota bacterium]
MESLSIADVLTVTGGSAIGSLSEAVDGVSTDSRTVQSGDLFVALRGERFDGHEYLQQAADRGAAAALVDRELAGRSPLPLIRVEDTGKSLLRLAGFQRRRLRARVVAITGSNGKTTTKDLCAAALSAKYRVVSSPHSFNNFIGVPLTLFMADSETEVIVLELGSSAPGEIAVLAAVAEPDVVVITNVAPAHLEGFGTLERVLEEKGSILEHVREGGCAVLNADDDQCLVQLQERAKCRVVTTGVRRRADYVATMPFTDLDRIAFHLNGVEKVRVPLLGCHNLYNSLTALAVASELGVPRNAAAASLRNFEGPPMRLKKHRRGSRLVIDDAYNANPGSMRAAFKTFASLALPGRKVLVLGDMLELGPRSAELHAEVGTELSCGSFDLVVVVGALAAHFLEGAVRHGLSEERMLRFRNAEECARSLPSHLLPDDAVLIKGSRAVGLEQVVQAALAREPAAKKKRRVREAM